VVPGGATPLVTRAESALVLLHSQAIERVTSQTDCLPSGTLGGHECAQHGEGYAQPAEHHDQPSRAVNRAFVAASGRSAAFTALAARWTGTSGRDPASTR